MPIDNVQARLDDLRRVIDRALQEPGAILVLNLVVESTPISLPPIPADGTDIVSMDTGLRRVVLTVEHIDREARARFTDERDRRMALRQQMGLDR